MKMRWKLDDARDTDCVHDFSVRAMRVRKCMRKTKTMLWDQKRRGREGARQSRWGGIAGAATECETNETALL